MPARPRLRSAGISALAAVFLGACGVSIQSSPVDIPPDKIPFGLMRTTTSTTGPTQPRQALMEVFFVSSGKLTASNRVVSGPLQISDALSTLLDGPTNLEAFAGITTDIPSGTSIRSSKLSGSTATVDLSQNFASVGGQSQILAIAQIVFTLTQTPGVRQVTFELGGTTTEVPAADGTLLEGPVNRSDYASLAPGIPLGSAG